MAIQNFPIANFSQSSYFQSYTDWRDYYSDYIRGYTTPTTASVTKTVSLAALPAGAVITGAKVYFGVNTGTYGGTYTPAYAAAVGVAGGNASVTFTFKSNTGGSYPTPVPYKKVYSDKTGTCTWSDAYVQITYTPPTAASVWGVTLDNSTSDIYAAPGQGVYLAWSAANGTNNTITNYNVQYTIDDVNWYAIADGWHRTEYANGTPGGFVRFRVNAVAPYGSNGWVNSPKVITRSAVGAPATCAVSPTECYPGDSVTLSWGAGSAGTGTSVAGYDVYRDTTKVTTVTGTSYTFAAPDAGSYAYTVKTVSSPAGYNSGASPTATLTVENPRSTGLLDKSTVPMDDTSTISVTVTPSDAAYAHKAVWYNTSGTDTFTEELDVGDTVSTLNPVPLAWCTAYTTAISGTAYCKIETYTDDTYATKIGELAYPFTVTVPASIMPTLSVADEPVDGFVGLYLKGISKVKVTLTDGGAQGSTIASRSITGGGFSGTSNPFTTGVLSPVIPPETASAVVPFTVTVTDTRGRQATQTVNITVTNYALPVIQSTSPYRSDSGGTKNDVGEYIRAIALLTVRSIKVEDVEQNTATATIKMRQAGGAWGSPETITHNTAVVLGGADATYAYDILITLTDTVGKTTTWTATIPPAQFAWDFHNDRAALGRLSGDVKTLVVPNDWTIQGGVLKSVVVTGTAPFDVASTTAVTNLNADMLDGVHLADIRLGQNLLHNWDFRNPVNQRGGSGAISTGTYFFDRWIRNSGTVTVATGYLTLASGAVIEQRIEGLYLAGETVSVSVKVDSTIYSGTGVFPTAAGAAAVTLTGFGTATLGYNAGYMFVLFTASGSQNVVAVKGELGPVSTLHLDPPMDHAVEVAKCQRYYRELPVGTKFYGLIAGITSYVAHYLNPPMRISPTLVNVTTFSVYYSGTSVTASPDNTSASPYRIEAGIVTGGGGPAVAETNSVIVATAEL